jgi:hypothetical protein
VAAATVLPAGARAVGPAPAERRLDLRIVLAPRDRDALDAFVAAASTPGTSAYGRYLAPGQYATRFGPTAASADAVRATLAADGIDVEPAPAGTTVLEASATSPRRRPPSGRRSSASGWPTGPTRSPTRTSRRSRRASPTTSPRSSA